MLQSFLTVGQQIITLYLLLVVGFVLGKVKILDDRASTAMSNLVMYGLWSGRRCGISDW